ncbi:MAG: hypothetical protein ACI3Y9_07715 [Candidatus Cryptobacteroides sp.]
MKTDKKKSYVSPGVSLTRIEIESGFMAASKEPVEDRQVDITIDKQSQDDDFTSTEWD